MRPDNKSDSFKFHKNVFTSHGSSRFQNCRLKLQDRFEQKKGGSSAKSDRSVLSVLSLNDTRKAIRNSADKLSRKLSNVRITLGNFSQRFKPSTKRRQILEEGPVTPSCNTPQARKILGRTPTKMYSPFGIETPKIDNKVTGDKENVRPVTERKCTLWARKRNLLDDSF